jgi:predicted amidohydrolase YtcJ
MELHADVAVIGGKIATMNVENRFVRALATKGDRILAAGEPDEIRKLVGPETTTIELDGEAVIPGIVDNHCHADSYAVRLLKWQAMTPPEIKDKGEFLAAIDRETRMSAKDRWFAGYRYDETKCGGFPTMSELDKAGNGRPVFVLRVDHHVALANAAAFAAAGIAADAADPPFGRFDRAASGTLTGVVRGAAAHRFLNVIHAGDTEDEIAEGLERVFQECLSFGITSIYNSLTPAKAIRAYQRLRGAGKLPIRIGIIASGRDEGLVESLIAAGMRSGFGDDWLRLIGVEWCPDGSTSGRTAAYHEPYVGTPAVGEPKDNRGMLLYEAEDLKRRVSDAHKAGLQVCLDGVGDRGIDFCLDAIEAALRAHPVDDHRMRVEHCCYATPTIRERLKKLNVIASMGTGFMYNLGDAYVANRGEAAMEHMWPFRSLIQDGIVAPAHSDAPVSSFNPFLAIWSMTKRISESRQSIDIVETITTIESVRAYTRLGAYSGREEHVKGSLDPGMLADFAILKDDIFTVPLDFIRRLEVARTFVGGVERYRAAS